MDGQIPEEVSKARIAKLIDLQNRINREISEGYISKTVEVLTEGYDEKKKMYFGREEFGKMIYFTSEKDVFGEFINVKITKANGISLIGTTEN